MLWREPRTYPQVWCLSVGVGLAAALGVLTGGHAVDTGLAVGAAIVTLCMGVFGSYRLSRQRATAADQMASGFSDQVDRAI